MNPEDSIATLLKLNGFGFNGLDVFAFVWFLVCTVGFTLLVHWTGIEQRGLVGAIHEQRVRWLSNMAHRNDRVIDTLLLSSVASGHTFFASTSVILMGALATLLGAGDRVGAILGRLPFAAPVSPVAWDFKVLLLMAVFVYAFFKFAWAFRLAHYALIMVGSTPIRGTTSEAFAEGHAIHAARIAGLAAGHANSGLRAYYFAMAGIGWFFHPLVFVITTTWVALIITRREYFSRSLQTIRDCTAGVAPRQ